MHCPDSPSTESVSRATVGINNAAASAAAASEHWLGQDSPPCRRKRFQSAKVITETCISKYSHTEGFSETVTGHEAVDAEVYMDRDF